MWKWVVYGQATEMLTERTNGEVYSKYAAYKVHVMGMEMVYSEIGHELKPHVMIHSVTQIKLKSKT